MPPDIKRILQVCTNWLYAGRLLLWLLLLLLKLLLLLLIMVLVLQQVLLLLLLSWGAIKLLLLLQLSLQLKGCRALWSDLKKCAGKLSRCPALHSFANLSSTSNTTLHLRLDRCDRLLVLQRLFKVEALVHPKAL